MKRIKCPRCNKLILKTIEIEVKGRVLYYLSREQFGNIYFPRWDNIRNKEVRKKTLKFYCRACHMPFPKEMEKKIYHWVRLLDILRKLQDAS